MTLDNLMNMATADRYTEDGRQQIEDARRTYKPGEISEKTGFQKQNDGTWAPPKAGAAAGERKKHDPVTGEGKDFRVVKNGKVLASKGSSLKDIEEVGKKNESAGSSRGKSAEPTENLKAWEESVKTDARNYNENIVVLQNEAGDVKTAREGHPDVEKAESHGYKKMSLVRPDGTVKRHQGNNPAPGSTAAAKEPDLSKVGHYNLNVARNDMNTTRAEDKWLDNFVTEMHEDGTSLDEIIKRQDEVFAKSKGRYPEEEKTYKSLREKIMKHYGGTSNADKAEIEKIKSGITGSTAAGNDKWAPAKDYLNREFLKMKTPSGGYVSIYETSNENQKNNRFRVDTGTHYNLFNTLEEAKAFAEYNYGETGDAACDEQLYTPESINGPREKLERQLTGDTRIRVKK